MENEPENYICYVADELKCNKIGVLYSNSVSFYINTDEYNRGKAEKIAKDYFTELRAYGGGGIYQENIDFMNEKFEEPFKEKERIKKEKETRQKELAELARLKEKYESN